MVPTCSLPRAWPAGTVEDHGPVLMWIGGLPIQVCRFGSSSNMVLLRGELPIWKTLSIQSNWRRLDAITEGEMADLRIRLDIGDGPVGLYIGSLYLEKRIGFLLDAVNILQNRYRVFIY